MKIDRSGLTKSVEIVLEREDAETSYMSAGFDEATTRWIENELRRGNHWAWCDVKVTARIFGLSSESYLGQCSYESREDFKKCGYYDSMVGEVVEDLALQLESITNDHTIWDHDRVTCIPCATTSAS